MVFVIESQNGSALHDGVPVLIDYAAFRSRIAFAESVNPINRFTYVINAGRHDPPTFTFHSLAHRSGLPIVDNLGIDNAAKR